MSSKSPILNPEQHAGPAERDEVTTTAAKKQFVEPEVSAPVDVLAATSFFILADSGGSEDDPI